MLRPTPVAQLAVAKEAFDVRNQSIQRFSSDPGRNFAT